MGLKGAFPTPGLCRGGRLRPCRVAGAHPAFTVTLCRNVFARRASKIHSAAPVRDFPCITMELQTEDLSSIAAANHILVAGRTSRMDRARHPPLCGFFFSPCVFVFM